MKKIKNFFKKRKAENKAEARVNDVLYNKDTNEATVNDVVYVLNQEEKTASIKNGRNVFGNICIPRSIKVKGQEYIITSILTKAFLLSNIFEVTFAKDSQLKTLEDESFYNCAIRTIDLPSHVTKIGNKAFFYSNQFLKINIPENSELKTIGESAFAYTKVDSISIPSCLTEIKNSAFIDCYYLTKVDIPSNSKLEKLGSNAFINTQISDFYIPSNLNEINEGCFATILPVNFSISPSNHSFSYYNNDFIVGKSDQSKNEFDIIIASNRKITNILIPSSIKRISNFAFYGCKNLNKIEFEKNSELQSIGSCSFYDSNIESFSLPLNVTTIGAGVFEKCEKLQIIEIPENSKIKSIDDMLNKTTIVGILMISSQLKHLVNKS